MPDQMTDATQLARRSASGQRRRPRPVQTRSDSEDDQDDREVDQSFGRVADKRSPASGRIRERLVFERHIDEQGRDEVLRPDAWEDDRCENRQDERERRGRRNDEGDSRSRSEPEDDEPWSIEPSAKAQRRVTMSPAGDADCSSEPG